MVRYDSDIKKADGASAKTTAKLPIIRTVMRCGVVLTVIALLIVKSTHASVPSDSQLFTDSFNLFRSNDYPSSLAKLNSLLTIYPGTPLRDAALLLQAQASAKVGNQLDAAQAMVIFLREYPDSPLKANASTELTKLAVRLQSGEKLANRLSVQSETAGLVTAREELELSGSKTIEQERLAKLKAEEERNTRANIEQERLAAKKAEEQRLAREQAERERLAKQRAEEEKLAAETAERERLAREKAERERLVRLKAEEEKLARVKVEQERLAAAQAEEQRLAREQAEQERLAKQRAEEEKLAAETAERERLAREKAELERLARLKAEEGRLSREKIEQERLTAAKAEEQRLARERVEQERIAKNIELERLQREHVEKERLSAQKLDDERTLERNVAIEMGKRASTVIRVGTQLSTTVAAVKTAPAQAAPSLSSMTAHSPPEFSMECFPPGESNEVARMVSIPFTITNLGAEPDRYRISSDLPADFSVTFAAVERPGRLLRETGTIPPSSAFRGIMKLRLPGKSIDGQTYPASLTAVSNRDAHVAISKKVHLVAAAPLLSSAMKPLKKRAAPGETVVYRLILMNVGSMTAREVAMKLLCPPALEPAATENTGFRRETDGSLVTEGIELPTGEIREFALTFRVGTTTAHDTTLSCRLDTENRQLGNAFTVTSGNVLVGP